MIETLILGHLIRDAEFTRIVIPFLQKDYFTTSAFQLLFENIQSFTAKYKATPTVDALRLAIDQASMTGGAHEEAVAALDAAAAVVRVDSTRRPWLIDQAEAFCKQRALYLAMSESLTRIDKDFESASSVPDLLKDALAVGFRAHIGHDYFADLTSRYDQYHKEETRVSFDLEIFNKITGGGLTPKTLNVVVAGTAVGKSLFLCHVAASTIASGKRVLYITMEMSEERIAQRIDANLLDVTMDEVEKMDRDRYVSAFTNLRKRQIFGDLIIKEYPTSAAHTGHFRVLLDELKMKKGFHPDLLIIDYLNICSSSRFKAGGQFNSYMMVKSIAEELRGLATEYALPVLTATQFNRAGFDSSDPSLTDTSESFGLPQTADLQVALVTSNELEADGLLMVKQLKNRYADTSKYRRFTIRCDKSKMRLSNDPNPQRYMSDTTRVDPVEDTVVSRFVPKLVRPDSGDDGPKITF